MFFLTLTKLRVFSISNHVTFCNCSKNTDLCTLTSVNYNRDAGEAAGQGAVKELREMGTYKNKKILLPIMLVSLQQQC